MGRCGDRVATRGSAPPPPEGHTRSPGTDRRNRSRRATPGAPRCCPPSHTAPDRSRSFPPAGPFVQAGPRPPATPSQASAPQRPRADAGGEEGGAAALSGPARPAQHPSLTAQAAQPPTAAPPVTGAGGGDGMERRTDVRAYVRSDVRAYLAR